MSDVTDFSHFVEARPDRGARMELAVENMHCASCMRRIEAGLKDEPGIRQARVNLSNRRVEVEWEQGKANAEGVIAKLAAIGFAAYPFTVSAAEKQEKREEKRLLLCLAVSGFAMMNIMLLSVSVWSGNATAMSVETRDFFHWLSGLIAIPASLYAGRPFFESAWAALKARALNMDVPISLGVLLSLGVSVSETLNHAEHVYFDSAVMLLFFLLVGRYLERAMRRKTRAVADNLAALKGDTATKYISETEVRVVPVAALKVGDVVLARAGERIAVDGRVIAGASEIDQSLVTGETRPQAAQEGAEVYAGTLNLTGTLRIRVTTLEAGTLLSEVQRLIDKATESRSATVHLADQAARLYSPVVHLTALATFIGWVMAGIGAHDALIIAITVLIITCPCALGLAIPAVQVVASGALFRNRILLHGGDALERLAKVDTVVFDKTGTLTRPVPSVLNAGEIAPDVLALAGRMALSSRHPLAMALAKALRATEPVDDAQEEAGIGVRATLDGQSLFLGTPKAIDLADKAREMALRIPSASLIGWQVGDAKGLIAIGQAIRSDARAVIAALKADGYALEILSGDHRGAVEAAARELGITQWAASLKPADKIARLEALKTAGHKVMMIGDGLNDAPALAAATVSLSPIEATHVTQAQADAVFMGEALAPVRITLLIGRKAHAMMIQNLWLAVIYNIIAVPIAIAGYVTPLIAAIAMSGSSVIVTLNALRAGRVKGGDVLREPSPMPLKPLEALP